MRGLGETLQKARVPGIGADPEAAAAVPAPRGRQRAGSSLRAGSGSPVPMRKPVLPERGESGGITALTVAVGPEAAEIRLRKNKRRG